MRSPFAGPRRSMNATPDKARDTWRTLLRLLPLWFRHWRAITALMLCSLISVGVSLLTPVVIGRAIDRCIIVVPSLSVNYQLLITHLLLLAALYALALLTAWWQDYGMVRLSQNVVRDMRRQMMDHLLNLDVRYYDVQKRGDIISRFANDAELIKEGFGPALIQSVTTVATLVGMIAVMALLCPMLTAVVCLSIPIVMSLTRVVSHRSRRFFARQQDDVARLNDVVDESINGLRVIRSLGCADGWRQRFNDVNDSLRESGTKAQINSGLLMPILRLLDNITYAVVAVVGGLLCFRGAITVGVIQSFLLYTRRFLRPVNMIATQLNSIQSAVAGAERIFDMLDTVPALTNSPNAVLPESDVVGRVVFENVSFGYNPSCPVLKGVSFDVSPGKVVAIVGGTGAGKTTLMNLLSRFYDIDGGRILLDGVDIRCYDITFLRDSLAMVLQEPILFSDTVLANIAYGDPAKSDLPSVRHSAQQAMADGFICRMPYAYGTELLRQGENISNGQRQLLTIARAVHSNAPILVLDEATSNIDTHTEKLLQKAISNLSVGRTCFIIAHRLSTIRNADTIIVMDDGRIAEQGSHSELLSLGGLYRKLYESQFAC